MAPSSNRRAATRAARARQQTTGETYNGARRAGKPDVEKTPDVKTIPDGHAFKRGHWIRERCADWGCNLERDHPVHQIGGLTPPQDWPDWCYGKPMLSTTPAPETLQGLPIDPRSPGEGETQAARRARELRELAEAERQHRGQVVDGPDDDFVNDMPAQRAEAARVAGYDPED